MLKGKFRDRTHLGCGYPLYLATPVSIAWFETGYFAKCPRCLADLPVDIDSEIPETPIEPETIIIEAEEVEPEVEPEAPEGEAEAPAAEEEAEPEPEAEPPEPEPEAEPESKIRRRKW